MELPEGYADLFADDVVSFLVLGTSSGEDRVAVAPVWFLTDDRGLVFTSEDDSIKARNVRRQPEVAAALLQEGDHARYVSVLGSVEELTPETDDIAALYRRLVARYQKEPLLDPEPENFAYFRLVPRRMRGYDYRDYQA
jgi:nitroimidazol reductase NimA-like FMN-containing flavoprotein (pyridoxamine 5'-phosphate oxidase superfamily)